jgi:tripartite-type tricarboxylate transporter receptor subunit TctC
VAAFRRWAEMLRTFLATITLVAPAITVAPSPSHAQSDYPNRMVRIVVPYGAGTVPDILSFGVQF